MAEPKRQIYRQESLDRLAVPDRLDQLVRIVGAKAWLALVGLAAMLSLAIAWSILGRIPITAEGVAILTKPRHLVAFQAPAEGLVERLDVKVGDDVQKGQVLGTLFLPELKKQIEQEGSKLEQTIAHAKEVRSMEKELADLDKGLLEQQKKLISDRITSVGGDAKKFKDRSEESIKQQRSNIKKAKELSEELSDLLQTLFKSSESIMIDEQPVVSKEQQVGLRTRWYERQLLAEALTVDAQELELREIVVQESYNRQMDLVQDLEGELKEIEVRTIAIDRRLRVRELEDKAREQELKRGIDFLDTRLETEGRILSEYTGHVIEITTFEGERVDAGGRLGRLEIQDDQEVMAVAYFRIEDGKKAKPGDRILVSPSTVERERFGAIEAKVVSVSKYPVTTPGAANQIGDLEIARGLLQGENRIEVLVRLERDPATESGFKWTSGAGPPEIQITAGTTAGVRVTVEERSPLSFVLPLFESLSGI